MGDYRNTWDDFVTKTNTNNEKLLKGDIKLDQRLLRSTGDMVGLMGGIVGDVLGDVGDAITPDFLGVEDKYQEYVEKPVQEAALKLADTKWGREAVEYAKKHPEGMEDLVALSNVGSLFGVGRVGNAVARNMPTHVRGFYSGNLLKKMAGTAEAAAKGSKDALLNSFSPKGLAFQDETGLSRGLIQKARHTEALAKRREELVKGATMESMGLYNSVGTSAIDKLAKFDKKWKGEGSYSEGQLAFTYLFRQQMGEDIPKFLKDNFEDLNILSMSKGPDRKAFNKQVFEDPKSQLEKGSAPSPDVPPKTQDWLQNKAYEVWHLNSERGRRNTLLVVKDPAKQHDIDMQAVFPRGGDIGNTKFFTKFGGTGIDLETASVKTIIDAAKGRSLTKDNKVALAKVENGKPLTKIQKGHYKDAQKRLSSEEPLKYDEESGVFWVDDSFRSGAKELGGVNRITTLDRKGNVTILVTDKHDMFGFDPIDGKSLLNVFPPVRYNVFKGVEKLSRGEGVPKYSAGVETQKEAASRLTSELGKEKIPKAEKIYAGKYPRHYVARGINQRIIQEADSFKPTASQYRKQLPRVASNAALGANYGAGMLSGMDREN